MVNTGKGGAGAPPFVMFPGKMNQNRQKNEGHPQENYKMPLDKRDRTVYNNYTRPAGDDWGPVR